jgi:hypothetical protein
MISDHSFLNVHVWFINALIRTNYSQLESVVGASNDWISFHLAVLEFSTDTDSELASSMEIWRRLFLINFVGHLLKHLNL